nr:hypothetical protein [Psychrobacter sp. PraFG1]UNK04862.1 hypothetical protein MN210_12020 [Psychrobacter sp. PraFG1]
MECLWPYRLWSALFTLSQINTENVKNLEVAWQIQTDDVKGPKDIGETTYQATPLKIGNALYLCTPHNWVMALDADTGESLWTFDPKVGENQKRQHQTCRGVSFYAGSQSPVNAIQASAATSANNTTLTAQKSRAIPLIMRLCSVMLASLFLPQMLSFMH